MHLSRNFTINELVKSQTAIRNSIDNTPDSEQIVALTALCHMILQPCRDNYGMFTPNSAFRTIELCELIGSSPDSQHTLGEAADIEMPGVDNYKFAEWIIENLEFDQLILEFYKKGEPNSGWVHVSYAKDREQRKEIRHSVYENNKIKYPEGLV